LVRSISASTIFLPIALSPRHFESAKQKSNTTTEIHLQKKMRTHLHPRFLSLSSTESTFGACNQVPPSGQIKRRIENASRRSKEGRRDSHAARALLGQDRPGLRVLPQPKTEPVIRSRLPIGCWIGVSGI
jgi:hypothetical protein